MIGSTFTLGTLTIVVPIGHAYNSPENINKTQLTQFDSSGGQYIYDKSNKRTHVFPLLFEGVSLAVFIDLQRLFDTADGAKTLWTWTDAYGTDHQVRFAPGTGVKKTFIGGDCYNVEITLEEYL